MCTDKELSFIVFVIHSLSEAWGKLPKEVYEVLIETKILEKYIIEYYDVLHTMGKEALVEDITDFVKEEGIKL